MAEDVQEKSEQPAAAPSPQPAGTETPSAGPSTAPKEQARPGRWARMVHLGRERIRQIRAMLWDARYELTWFLYGLALVALSIFNDYHGLALSTKMPILGLDLGFVYLVAGGFLLLTRVTPAPARDPAAKPDWAARIGAALLVFGLGAEGLASTTGAFSTLTAGGVFLPDLGIVAGGLLFIWRASRPVLPTGRVWNVSFGVLLAGTLVALVYNYLARAPFVDLYQAYFAQGGQATFLAGAGLVLNPLAPAVAAEQGALGLLGLARQLGLDLSGPPPALGWLGMLSFFGLAGMVWAGLRRAPASPGREPRPGSAAVVLLAGALLYLPTLGGYALYDPWEGHYAETARQVVFRDDWVSLFWENNWFWSKPVGIMWMMAVPFKLFGTSDFVARLPFALTGIAGLYFVYYFCRKFWSARAGVIAAVVLACFPQYLFISRQVMTDIPVAVLMLMGLGLLIMALFAKEEDEVERTPLTILFVAIFAATSLPQYGMLASELKRYGLVHAVAYLVPWLGLFFAIYRGRKARQIYAYGFYLCLALGTLAKGFLAPGLPAIVVVGYLLCTGQVGDLLSGRRLGWGLLTAVVGFGIAALVIRFGFKIQDNRVFESLLVSVGIGAAALGIIVSVATAKGGIWDRLELRKGLLIFAIVGLPWYIAMAARHGGAQLDANAFGGFRFTGFLHEFIVQHHFDRLGGGVHGDTGTTFEYFFRWGAYAMFPWVALIPAALSRFWNERPIPGGDPRGEVKLFLFLWFAVFFTLFTLSATKFHHYILPALPPLAIMAGVWLDRAARDEREIPRAALIAGIAILAFVGYDILRTPQTFFNSFTYVFSGRTYPWPTSVMPEAFLKLFLVTACAVLFFGILPRPAKGTTLRNVATFWALFFFGLVVAAILWVASPVAPKLVSTAPDRLGEYREALALVMPMPPAALMTEYVQNLPHDRFWVHAGKLTGRLADFGFGLLAAFAALAACVSVFWAGRRKAAVAAFGGVAFVFGLWCAHWYMPELGPHSGQRHMFEAYYKLRRGPEEKICAYMMNWRSEHWYSENEVWVALSDQKLLEHARRSGRQWVVTERQRVGDVRNLLNRNQICKKVAEWDLLSNRYALASIEEDPDDPQVRTCLQQRR